MAAQTRCEFPRSVRKKTRSLNCSQSAALHPKPFSQLLRRQPNHPNHLLTAALAGRNTNGRSRNLQKICKEFNTGFIGASFDRRRSKVELEGIAQFADDGIPLRTRLHFHRKTDARGTLVDWDHAISKSIKL